MTVATPVIGTLSSMAVRSDNPSKDAEWFVEKLGMEIVHDEGYVQLKNPGTGQLVTLIPFETETPWALLDIETPDINASIDEIVRDGGELREDGRSKDGTGFQWALVCSGPYPIILWQTRESVA